MIRERTGMVTAVLMCWNIIKAARRMTEDLCVLSLDLFASNLPDGLVAPRVNSISVVDSDILPIPLLIFTGGGVKMRNLASIFDRGDFEAL